MEENIKTSLEYLANLCLENSGKKTSYSDTDLVNCMLVVSEVIMNKCHDYHKALLTQEQMEKLAHELGTSLRQTVKLFTNVDLPEAVRKSLE